MYSWGGSSLFYRDGAKQSLGSVQATELMPDECCGVDEAVMQVSWELDLLFNTAAQQRSNSTFTDFSSLENHVMICWKQQHGGRYLVMEVVSDWMLRLSRNEEVSRNHTRSWRGKKQQLAFTDHFNWSVITDDTELQSRGVWSSCSLQNKLSWGTDVEWQNVMMMRMMSPWWISW